MADPNYCHGIGIAGLAACVPSEIADNATLDALDEKSRQEIVERIGIRFRRIARPALCASDLCEKSANKLLSDLSWNRSEIELIVFVSQTPDHLIPGTAPALVQRLELNSSCMAIDINQGCSGYVNGLSITAGLMKAYGLQKALLLVGDTITRTIASTDMSLVPIFSDAGSATALELTDSDIPMTFLQGSIGEDHKAIHIPHGGGKEPFSADSLIRKSISDHVERTDANLAMNGKDVFTFGLTTVPKNIQLLLEKTDTQIESVDALVLHQANQFLSDLIAKKVGISNDKTPSSLYHYGNTSCATIPVTMVTKLRERLTNEKLNLLLSGFGVGLSWANAIVVTDKIVCPELIEI